MTLVALFQLSGRIGLFLFGLESIWCGIWFALVYDHLPQTEPLRRLMPEAFRSNLSVLILCTCFGVGMMVFAVKIPAEQFITTDPGLLAGCTSLFWVAGAVALVRYSIHELRLASRIRRQQMADQAAGIDNTNPNWTDQ